MARRKKQAGAAPMQTRRARRAVVRPATAASDEPVESEPADVSDVVDNEPAPSTSGTQVEKTKVTPNNPSAAVIPVMQPCLVPIVALHKKFGKYRLLLGDDSYSRRSEVSGSDSETGSVEIRVVDPTASSESDSNAQATDEQSDDASVPFTLSPGSNVVNLDSSSTNSPAVSVREREEEAVTTESDTVCSVEAPNNFKGTVDVHLSNEGRQAQVVAPESDPGDELEDYGNSCSNIPLPGDDAAEMEAGGLSDEDVITVVQIMEDDTAEVYYDIKMDSPAEQSTFQEAPDLPPDPPQQVVSEQDLPIQIFQDLNLSMPDQPKSPMECTDSVDAAEMTLSGVGCLIGDIPSPLERPLNGLIRPDPSITPSSLLSDDSNSSRLPSECQQTNSNDSSESSPGAVRRSSRIKTISSLKQKTKGYGLVKTPLKKALITQTKIKLEEMAEGSSSASGAGSTCNSPSFPIPSLDMPVKVKSRWRRSSEMEMVANSPVNSPLASPNLPSRLPPVNGSSLQEEKEEVEAERVLSASENEKVIQDRLKQFQHLDENDYLCERAISKEAKKMTCDCFLTKEEVDRGELGCGEDCLNRLLMIECNCRCPVGDRCTNRRFQKRENASLSVFYADKKGCGVEAAVDIPAGEFLMEYVGEVLDSDLFYKRAQEYSDDNNLHHYFMSLKGDSVIDATMKGNISRFINHSCEPNAETQKWTVNGELRIGFFSKRDIPHGEEITFDYQFQRYGKVAQRCYCGAGNCRGWIGAEPDSDDEEEEDEEEEEDVSTSKTEAESKDPSKEDASVQDGAVEPAADGVQDAAKTDKNKKKKRERRKRYAIRPKAELAQDADIEDDLEALARTGIKNQSHTLTLSRTMVRAKTRASQAALLRLLREADLPCRRLFLDYRGLRLLAPWCSNATLDFRLEILQTLDRLPVPNKTMVQECRLFPVVERWLVEATSPEPPDDSAEPNPNIFIDEATGLPIDIPLAKRPEAAAAVFDKQKDNPATRQKVSTLSKQLLERWSSLKEVFKIPKKERIQQMKEHERQANVERRAADSSGARDRDRYAAREHRDREPSRDDRERSDREKDRERERERDREREREKERDKERHRERERDKERDRERDKERARERERDDRDRRKRRSSPDGRRSIRLEERVLAAIPPVSKEERRRAFAEAAAAAEQSRQRAPAPAGPAPHLPWPQYPGWPTPDAFPHQMFPPGMMGGPPGIIGPGMMAPGMMGPGLMGAPPMMGVMGPPPEMPTEWIGPNGEYVGPPQGYGPMAFGGPPPFCMPQPNFMGMAGYPMGYMFPGGGPPMPAVPAQFPAPPAALTQPPPGEPSLLPDKPPLPVDERWKGLLPTGWRSAKDTRGRTYYYHVKLRNPQWMPPTPPPPPSDDDGSSEEEEMSPLETAIVRGHETRQGRFVEGLLGICEVIKEERTHNGLIPERALLSCKPRKRRPGLVTERPISPRSEEDKLAGKMEVKRYKETKEKLRRRKEKFALQQLRALQQQEKYRRRRTRDLPSTVKIELESSDEEEEETALVESLQEEPPEVEEEPPPVAKVAPEPEEVAAVDPEEVSRRLKEAFRSSMARVMVQHLNHYRRRDATHARIINNADFKHLARKLTHFVMLKELKHCRSVEDLECNDSVKQKAKEFVRKYMSKFGPVYQRPAEEMD